MTGGPLLTTGEAARLLASSRQHVVDMCDRGDLRCVRVGSHRRIPADEVRRVLGESVVLTRDQERALWLHRALLAQLVVEPENVLALGIANLRRLRDQHPRRGNTARWLREWEDIFAGGADAVADIATSRSPHAIDLRQNSPFAGVISQEMRTTVLAAFARHWRDEHQADRRRRDSVVSQDLA